MTWRTRLLWAGIGAAFAVAALVAFRFALRESNHGPVSSGEVREELARERVTDIRDEAKTKRRAARARVDREVQDASASGDLADFVNSRTRR